MGFFEVTARILSSFFVLLVLTRLMGRKEISQLTFFNYVSGITIGSIAASLAVLKDLSIWDGIYALVGWSVLTVVMGLIDLKSQGFRKLVEGQPIIVIKKGQIMENELRKARLDVDALNAMLRQKNVFSIADVDYAIFETDGKLSVMKKESKQPLTQGDMNIQKVKTEIYPLPTKVVSDGTINKTNLSKLNLDEKWLEQQLRQAGVSSVSDVFYAVVQKDGTLYIDTKNDSLH
jgi:uncharacterized membrane protein YcaP (DUF421 family)